MVRQLPNTETTLLQMAAKAFRQHGNYTFAKEAPWKCSKSDGKSRNQRHPIEFHENQEICRLLSLFRLSRQTILKLGDVQQPL